MIREIERELLDELPADDRRATRARRDLQRVNAWMGHVRIMARALRALNGRPHRSIVELGAGDGTLLLRVARAIGPQWGPVRAVLVDRQRLVTPLTLAAFEALSWHVESVQMDVFEWLEHADGQQTDVVLANLFLHHFAEAGLRTLLAHAERHTEFFLACEPRRHSLALHAAELLWVIGCGDLARHDAMISVRAGFADRDLSALWPASGGWRLAERSVGPFSHCFLAQRTDAAER